MGDRGKTVKSKTEWQNQGNNREIIRKSINRAKIQLSIIDFSKLTFNQNQFF